MDYTLGRILGIIPTHRIACRLIVIKLAPILFSKIEDSSAKPDNPLI
jgi:hypothetical protein